MALLQDLDGDDVEMDLDFADYAVLGMNIIVGIVVIAFLAFLGASAAGLVPFDLETVRSLPIVRDSTFSYAVSGVLLLSWPIGYAVARLTGLSERMRRKLRRDFPKTPL